MPTLKQIDPMTTATLRLLVKDSSGALVTDGTATASVYNPTGKRIASGVPLTNAGAGVYTMTISAAWSDAGGGTPILGIFAALVTVVRSSQQRSRRIAYLVDFTD